MEDPYPNGKYPDTKVWVGVPFSCLIEVAAISVGKPIWPPLMATGTWPKNDHKKTPRWFSHFRACFWWAPRLLRSGGVLVEVVFFWKTVV